jgi:flagellar hook-associated protein 1 FlgK
MSGIIGVMNIGQSGIEANEAALKTAGHNLSNVNTPGYSRERVIFEQHIPNTGHPGMVGGGVDARRIRRVVNHFLENQSTRQKTTLGFWESSRMALGEIDSYYFHAQSEGLSQDLSRFFNHWETVANHPADRAARSTLIMYGRTLGQDFHQMTALYAEARNRLSHQIEDQVGKINSRLERIAKLNHRVLEARGRGEDPNTFLDERSRLVMEVSRLTNAHFFHDKDGSLNLHLGGQAAFSEQSVGHMSAVFDPVHDRYRILFSPPAHSGPPLDITDRLKGGVLGGYLDVRDRKLKTMEHHLDVLAHQLVNGVNAAHARGYGLSGQTGVNFFVPTVDVTKTKGEGTGGLVANVSDSSAVLPKIEVEVNQTGVRVFSAKDHVQIGSGVIRDRVAEVSAGGYSLRVLAPKKGSETFIVAGGEDVAGTALHLNVADITADDIAAAHSPVSPDNNEGDNANAHQIFYLSQKHLHFQGEAEPSSIYEYYASGVARIGAWARQSRLNDKAQVAISQSLENQRLAVSGVSIANESAKIIRFEKAYQASANLIQMVNRLLDTLIRLPNSS